MGKEIMLLIVAIIGLVVLFYLLCLMPAAFLDALDCRKENEDYQD